VVAADCDVQDVVIESLIGESGDVRKEVGGPRIECLSNLRGVLHSPKQGPTVEAYLPYLLQSRNARAECLATYNRGNWRIKSSRTLSRYLHIL